MHKNFYLALIGIGIGGIGFGLITPVTVMLLEQNKAPAIITGSITMVGYLSVVIFSPFASIFIEKYSIKKILGLGLFIWSIGALAHIFWFIYPLLYLIKFLMGIGGTMIFVPTEVIINYSSNENNRGKNIGLYVVLLSVGIAVGTFLIWTIKIAQWMPFVLGSLIMFTVFVFQMIFFEDITINYERKDVIKMPLSQMPLISLISAAVYGMFESSLIVVIPMFGLRNLFTLDQVSYFLASFVVGGILLLYLIGFISDKVNKYKLLLSISVILGLFNILTSFYINFIFLICIFFFIGGIVPSIYTVGLSYTVERIEKKFMAQANGYYIMMYGIGTILGPILGAMLMDLDSRYGYWIFAFCLCISFFILFFHGTKAKL